MVAFGMKYHPWGMQPFVEQFGNVETEQFFTGN